MASVLSRLRRFGAPLAALAFVAVLTAPSPAAAQAATITVASTTSTEQSGLFKHLLPAFEKDTGIQVKVVAVGTGQALDIGRRGDADVVFVHDAAAEEKFVAEGAGVDHKRVMYNDFVIVGPKSDPAKIRGDESVLDAMRKIAEAKAPFASRGDRSGTNAAELRYWKAAGVEGQGSGYKPCGCGMGPALNIAASTDAYILADRATWLNFKNQADLAILVEGDERMFNQYGVMVVNPEKFSHLKAAEAQRFVDWVISREGQQTIADYKINGEQLFFPNANPS